MATPAGADDEESDDDRSEREAVRGAVERGEIKPLVDVLNAVRPQLPGEIVGVEIEARNGTWIYEFRVAKSTGRLVEVYVDAATAEVLKIEEK
ncbi:MAG: PepSY domain-containing protein [Hyphomicrobium sp.]|jgi:uncharacterized membrane protein YkoI